jgi:glutamate synthase domain-containing protein 3
MSQEHGLQEALDNKLIEIAEPALKDKTPVRAEITLRNINRTVGTMLSAELTRKYGEAGLPDDTIYFKAKGTGGQSFGAFLNSGISFEIEGDANDYFGKGLCGGKLILYPPKASTFDADKNVILGNVAFYGATSGTAYIYGMAGERFCVRNSGANIVVSSVGDHGCEYMTGGRVVVLGEIGKNFAAGMSGGIAYLHDPERKYINRINKGSVLLETMEEDGESESVVKMIQDYAKYTNSSMAKDLVANWQNEKSNFVKVMPTDYKKALGKA